MRGANQEQDHIFSYRSPAERVPMDHPLRAVKEMANRAPKELSSMFSNMYAPVGRPSIPQEKMIRSLLLQVLYSIRSERMLMEQLDYNLLFRWFVGLSMDDEVWDYSTFSKNRERLLNAEIVQECFKTFVNRHERKGCYLTNISPLMEHSSKPGRRRRAFCPREKIRESPGSKGETLR